MPTPALKLTLPLLVLGSAALVYFALFAGESEVVREVREERLASPREIVGASRPEPELGPAPALPEPPPEARLEVELVFEKVAELDPDAEELPFAGAFSGVVAGFVFDAGSAPLPGALIEVVGGPSAGRVGSTSFTGAYRLEGLAPGLCELRFSAASAAPITKRVVIPSEGSLELEATLTPGVAYFGRVLGSDGKGLAGATVEIEGRRATSDGAGRWSLADVPSGNDIAVYAWAPGCALQRLQVLVPNELPAEDWPGLQIVLLRGARLEVKPEGFPLSAPLRVSIVPKEGYANSSYPTQRFLDLPCPVDGSPLAIEGLPHAFLGEVLVAHPFASAQRSRFPLVIGASDPMPLTVVADPVSSRRARGRVLAAPSGEGAGIADASVRIEPADLAPFLVSFGASAGELRPLPSLSWLSAETITREQGRFELDLGFPPPWIATVRREGFATKRVTIGADVDALIRLEPAAAPLGTVVLEVAPARAFRVAWTRGAPVVREERDSPSGAAVELGSFEPAIYRVQRTLQGQSLFPAELRVEVGRAARLSIGWGRQ